jgi:predicted amidohydrolase YtcJ
VLSHDIFAVPFDEILEASVLLTLVDGEEVYRDTGLD